MNLKILDTFRLQKEKEDFRLVKKNIEEDAVFHGTNLWVLFFAILVASLGLNINSTAVIIGAMLISPLMGPIVGVGFGVAIHDLQLIKKAARNYAFAGVVGLVASTIYFLITPINDAHSEILSRTLPTVYDVLIALFAGFAGIIALSSKHKGNVIPGVAIATALIPPLCTAGYGLATWHWNYFLGALYLYLINSVFIATASLITVYLLKFPSKKYEDPAVERRERRIVGAIIMLTLIPSIYLGYNIVSQNNFTKRAEEFIKAEAKFPNDYLLEKDIDARNRKITLIFGGEEIAKSQVDQLREKLKYYNLENVSLEVQIGFSFLKDNNNNQQVNQLGFALRKNEEERIKMQNRIDSITDQNRLSMQVYKEIKVQYPALREAIIQPVGVSSDSSQSRDSAFLVMLEMERALKKEEEKKLEEWLKVRLNDNNLRLMITTNESRR